MGFLRPDHQFLSSALHHPSTSFLLFNKLEPLVKSATELARCTFSDVKPVIGDNPFEKSEEDLIAQYNSTLYTPQIIFLGLDERKEGFKYKEHYKGQPWFAVDVTPQESVKEKAEELIKKFGEQGLEFSKGRMHMSLPAEEGAQSPYSHTMHFPHMEITKQLTRTSRHLRRSPPPPRLERPKPLLRLMRLQDSLRKCRFQAYLSTQGHCIQHRSRRATTLRHPHGNLQSLLPAY